MSASQSTNSLIVEDESFVKFTHLLVLAGGREPHLGAHLRENVFRHVALLTVHTTEKISQEGSEVSR